MKITRAEIFLLNGRPPTWRPVVCRLDTDEGLYGYGEAAIGFDRGSNAAFEAIRELAPMVIGLDPLDGEVIAHKLATGSFWGLSGGPVLQSAVSALDTAVWDIRAKSQNLPLYKALGGAFRDKLRSYASQLQFGWGQNGMETGRGGSAELLAQSAAKAKDEGYTAVKINFIQFAKDGEPLGFLTGPLSRETRAMVDERMAGVRKAVGEETDIIVENHGRADVLSACDIARIAGAYGALFLEEPCLPTDLNGYRSVRAQSAIPLAAGERLHNRRHFLEFLQSGVMQIAQPDIGTCGGVSEAKKICDLAYIMGASVQLHVCGSPIVMAASLHLGAAIPNFTLHEHMIAGRDRNNAALGIYDYQPKNGFAAIPQIPGIGQELSDKAMAEAIARTVVDIS